MEPQQWLDETAQRIEVMAMMAPGGSAFVEDVRNKMKALAFYIKRGILQGSQAGHAPPVTEKREVAPAFEKPAAKVVSRTTHRLDPLVEVKSQRKNDCPVVALATICNLPYDKARIECFTHGWSSTRGITRGFVELMCEKHGLEATFRPDIRGMSVQFLADRCPDGVFLVYVQGHVMPMANGQLMNWTQARFLVVTEVVELHPKCG